MALLAQISFVVLLLALGLYAVPTFVAGLVSFLIASVIGVFALLFLAYFKESVSKDVRPPVVGSVLSLLIHFNHLYDYLSDLAKKHKTFRFVGPHHNEVFTADPVNVEHLLRANFANYGKGKNHYMILNDLFGDGIFAVDGEKWKHQRKLASHEFSTKNLRDFSTAVFRSNAAKLASKIYTEGKGKKIIDLQDLFLRSTLDAIFTVGFGVELNSLSGSDDFGTRFTKAFDDSNFITYKRYVDLFWKAKRYLNIGLESCLKKNIKVIDDFVYKLILYKREQMTTDKIKSGREDMLSRFLIESQKDPAKMSDKYLRDITLNFIIAGRDSSANTLTWFFYLLCKHPQVRDKVVKNVQEATDTKDSNSMSSFDEFCAKVTEESLDKMHYLHAAITETMRLYPAVPLDGKCAEADDILPDGTVIKKGDNLSYMAYPMGRMEYIWGENAEEYFPERWIDETGVFCPESPFKFTTFQAGPRVCLGKEFAYRQIKMLSAVLLYLFKFDLADEHRLVTYQTMFTLHMHQGLHVLVNPTFPSA